MIDELTGLEFSEENSRPEFFVINRQTGFAHSVHRSYAEALAQIRWKLRGTLQEWEIIAF